MSDGRTRKDEIIDDAIDELIRDDLAGFYLITTHNETESERPISEVWFDDPDLKLPAGDQFMNSSTVKAYTHINGIYQAIREETGQDIDFIDYLRTLEHVHEHVGDVQEITLYEPTDDTEGGE